MTLSELKRFVLDMFFPPRCFGCGAYDAYLCGACAATLEVSPLVCPVCGGQSFTGERHLTCGKARHGLDGLTSVWRYDGAMRNAIQGIKYHHIYDAIPELMARAASVLEEDWFRYERFFDFAKTAGAIAYVPMRARAEHERGFNQARLIAEHIARRFGKPVSNLFRKVQNIPSQTTLEDTEARARNVRGAFALKAPPPQKLIIIDDVWTTGATMQACARAARQPFAQGYGAAPRGGAEEIWGFTLTRAV